MSRKPSSGQKALFGRHRVEEMPKYESSLGREYIVKVMLRSSSQLWRT
jgi:hypothetical protein